MAKNTNPKETDLKAAEAERLEMIKNIASGRRPASEDPATGTNSKVDSGTFENNSTTSEHGSSDTGLTEEDTGFSPGAFFNVLMQRRDALGHSPWSIAELKLTPSEIASLHNWLRRPAQRDIIDALDRGWSKSIDPNRAHNNKIVIGLLLHTIFAEQVRRHGTEGQYWGCIFNTQSWKTRDRTLLFLSNGQPNSTLRDLLENSAQALKMRHTFGIDGVQQYFSTGFLQFGFTLKGFKNRLGEWLAGYHTSTNAIESLRDGASLKSETFSQLWSALSAYRQRGLTEQQLENRIVDNCWILPEWIDELKTASRERLDLGTRSRRTGCSDEAPPFLSEPRLIVNESGIPEFHFSLIGLIDLPLTSASYTLFLNETPTIQLIRQQDGAYDPIGSTDFQMALPSCRVVAHISDAQTGHQAASQVLEFWQPDEFIQVFREDGRRNSDPFALTARQGNVVHILFPSLLEPQIEGSENSGWTSTDGAWKILSLSTQSQLTLFLDGEVFWSLNEALSATQETLQGREFIHNNLSINAKPVDIQSGLRLSTLSISAHESISIRWVRIALESISFESESMRCVLPVTPEFLEKGVSVQLAVEAFGQRVQIKKRIPIPFEGAFWIRQDSVKWEPPKVLHVLDAAEARLFAYPKNENEMDDTEGYCITEGNQFRRRLSNGPMQLTGLSGLGEPIYLQKSLFNNHETPQTVAEAVIDGGCIHQIKISEDCLRIFPLSSIEFKEGFVALAWVGSAEDGMRLERMEITQENIGDSQLKVWCAENTFAGLYINSVGIFYEGACIGSWWNLGSWTLALRNLGDREQAESYAKVMRLFNCPILHEATRTYVAQFLAEFAGEVLLAWLMPTVSLRLEDYKIRSDASKLPAWMRGVGVLFENSRPDVDICDASLVLEGLNNEIGDGLSEDSLSRSANILTAASPLVASKLLEKWLAEEASISSRDRATHIKQTLIQALEPSDAEVEDIAEKTIRADSHFLRQHCRDFGQNSFNLPPARRNNLPYIFEYSIPRRLAAAEYLKHHR